MLVGGLITAAVLSVARALESERSVDLKWLIAGWLFCALAVLAKGLIGIVLPGLVVVPWLVARGRWRQVVRLMHPAAVLAFALVAGPWFVSMQLSHPEFFDYFVIEQHFRRFAQSNFNNVHGFWFFFAVVPLLTLPWSMWLPLAAGHAWRTRGTPCGLYGWWVIVVLGFFSLPDSKLVGYALPALAPWCALLALAMGPWVHRFGSGLVLAAAATCVGIVVAAAWWAPGSNRELAQALAGRKGPHDRVVMVDEYLYDVPFYARLPDPVLVASDWADPQLPAHDNWRKELFDAARFDPVRGRELLIPLNALAGVTCTAPAVWFVVPAGREAAVAALSGSQRAFSNAHQALWRVPGRSCP